MCRERRKLCLLMCSVAVGLWLYGILRRVRLWLKEREKRAPINLQVAIRRLIRDVLCNGALWGRGLASVAHVLLFSGFVVLTMARHSFCIEHVLADVLGRGPGDPVFTRRLFRSF